MGMLANGTTKEVCTQPIQLFSVQLFFWGRGLNPGRHVCKSSALPLEPYFQSIVLWSFWRWGLVNYVPRLGLN
jgi:hypothetical protein